MNLFPEIARLLKLPVKSGALVMAMVRVGPRKRRD